jgi:hypothetical protein
MKLTRPPRLSALASRVRYDPPTFASDILMKNPDELTPRNVPTVSASTDNIIYIFKEMIQSSKGYSN